MVSVRGKDIGQQNKRPQLDNKKAEFATKLKAAAGAEAQQKQNQNVAKGGDALRSII